MAGKVAAHAAAGCASGAAAGGSYRSAALSAGLAELAGPLVPEVAGRNVPAYVASRAMVGGAASRLGGGSFENGAVTAAFGYLFNHCAHGGCSEDSREDGGFFGLRVSAGDLPSIPQGLADGVTGFGDGAYRAVTLGLGDLQDVRDVAGIASRPDTSSLTYGLSHGGGAVVGGVALAGSAGFLVNEGMWGRGAFGFMNKGQDFRFGYGKGPGFSLVIRAAGQWVDRITGKSHIDLIRFNRPYK